MLSQTRFITLYFILSLYTSLIGCSKYSTVAPSAQPQSIATYFF